jgi:hypothetical protein
MKVIDNFLDKTYFNNLKNTLSGLDFEWYISNVLNDVKTPFKDFQFIHNFYKNNFPTKNYPLIDPLIEKIKPFSLVKSKANLLVRTHKIIEHGFHTDFNKIKNLTTGILYINTCNGYTKFEDGSIVKSVENRFVYFNSNIKHTGSSCTDEKFRIVLNLNYFI